MASEGLAAFYMTGQKDSLLLSFYGFSVLPIYASWERLASDQSTQWFEYVLRKTLLGSIAQFKSGPPTFLVCVDTYDMLNPDRQTHAAQLINQYGDTDLIDVAGIILIDPAKDWHLTQNPSQRFMNLRNNGLFDAIIVR